MNSDWEIFNTNRINASAGAAGAQYYLGYCFLTGKNVAPDKRKAEKWLKLSAGQGYKIARRALSEYFSYDEEALSALEEEYKEKRSPKSVSAPEAREIPFAITAASAVGIQKGHDLDAAPSFSPSPAPRELPGGDPVLLERQKPATTSAETVERAPNGVFSEAPAEFIKRQRDETIEAKLADSRIESFAAINTAQKPEWSFTCLRDIRMRAQDGDAEAQFLLGECYYYGRSVDRDYAAAVNWYRAAAEAGHVESACQVGNCYVLGKGVDVDYDMAYAWYKSSAEDGSASALYNIALCCKNGWGVPINSDRELEYYTRAAEAGNARAQYDLGRAYYIGYGEQDTACAYKWLTAAAEQNLTDAMILLAQMYENGEGVARDTRQAFEYLQKVHNLGDTQANGLLAKYYYEGEYVERDPVRAAELALPVAELGNPDAQKMMAAYARDYGKAADAFRWWLAAAKSGDATALLETAKCYAAGKGIMPDTREAFRYFDAAARGGNIEAIPYLANCYKHGLGVEKNPAEGQRLQKWYKRNVG